MTRGVGLAPTLAEAAEAAEPLVAIVTQAGDTWLLGALAVSLYVLGATAPLPGWDRRRGATVLAVALLAVGTTGLLKATFALPRPPGAGEAAYRFGGVVGEAYAAAATAEGFGFPSGHAIGATAVYGTIAGLVAGTWRRRAAAVASVLVAAVMASRVLLGVHYPVDVVAGVFVGLLLVALSLRSAGRPVAVFAVAVAVAGGWAVVSDGEPTAAGTAGLCAGALLAWAAVGDRLSATPAPRGRAALLVVGAALAAGAVAAAGVRLGGRPAASAAGLLGMATVVALPLAARPTQ